MIAAAIVYSVRAEEPVPDPSEHLPPKLKRGSKMLHHLAREAAAATNALARAAIRASISEVSAALENNARPPVPPRIDIAQLPFVHHRYISGRVGLGSTPAQNLSFAATNDPSGIDPEPSTFWSPPENIAGADLRIGFGRASAPDFEEKIWSYAAPKTSYGANAGFEAECDGEKIKIKFGEIHSEPFAARIFHALGYHVDATDYSPGLRVRYDRRLVTEFNSRKPVNTRLTALGMLPVWTIRFQPEHDPLRFIAATVLKDGTHVSGEALRERLLRAGEFNPEFEAQIDHLITAPANVQRKDPGAKSIGPWDFGQLGHEHRRELRGAGLLAAWLGWFDVRADNLRLKVVETPHGPELRHYFGDVGGGLGKASGWSGWRGEAPEEFADFFTRPEIRQGQGRMTKPFRIVNYSPIEPVPAFAEMTLDDACWMARRIAQLTEGQIVEALRASGFDEATTDVYRRKLLARRDRMLRDLELSRGAEQSVAAK
jgi:hypothetical protein